MRVRLALFLDQELTIAEARQALFNWLTARHAGGKVVLRDRSFAAGGGLLPGLDDLSWLGLDWDAGPFYPVSRPGRYQEAASALPAAILSRLCGPDGRPTRALIDAVDDHDLRVTHVLHDDDQRASARQAVCEALGWDCPHDVTLPPLDGAGPEPVSAYRGRGYQPLALANHLARLGWMPRGKQRLLSLSEMAERFDLQRLSRSPCPWNPERLNWFNHRVLRQLDGAALARLAASSWTAAYGAEHRADGTSLSPERWQALLGEAIRDELHCLDEVTDRVRFAFCDDLSPDAEAQRALAQAYALPVLQAFVNKLPGVAPFDAETIDAWISDLRWRFKDALGIRSRDVMYVLHAALTGRLDGPCLFVVCQLLGRQRCLERAQRAIDTQT